MLTKILTEETEHSPVPKEGELYKEVTISDKTFRLLYGYYESFERESQFNEPMPIYPDFIKEPHYTADGIPIVTAMQNVCKFYNKKTEEDISCCDCVFFQSAQELFGFCNCPQNRQSCKQSEVVKNE